MKMMQKLKVTIGCLLMAGLVACGGGGGAGSGVSATGATNGTLRLALTDAPSCGYDAVNITVQKIRVHQSAGAADTDSGWSEIVLDPAQRLNLLDLTNGVLEELGQTALPAGKYTQLRLVLAENDAVTPLANSVLPTGGTEVALKTPSGQQSGVKANIDIDIAADQMADFVIDFDACKSVVAAGSSGKYLLKPVVRVIPRYVSGVVGFVDANLIGGSAVVSLQQAGTVVKATTPDNTGKFTLQPVAPGSYTLVLTAPGRTTMVITDVAVASDTVTPVNATDTRFEPPVSESGEAKGSAPADTTVRVLQELTGGPTIEVAGRFVDGATGSYSYPLVINAPLVAPYVALPGSLVFTADANAEGNYTLVASPGFTDKPVVLPRLTLAGQIVTTVFEFP